MRSKPGRGFDCSFKLLRRPQGPFRDPSIGQATLNPPSCGLVGGSSRSTKIIGGGNVPPSGFPFVAFVIARKQDNTKGMTI